MQHAHLKLTCLLSEKNRSLFYRFRHVLTSLIIQGLPALNKTLKYYIKFSRVLAEEIRKSDYLGGVGSVLYRGQIFCRDKRDTPVGLTWFGGWKARSTRRSGNGAPFANRRSY